MRAALAFQQTLVTEDCCSCGIVFAVPADFQRRMKETHKHFYCPSGHSMSYTGKTEAERLRDQLSEQTRVATAHLTRAIEAEGARDTARRELKRVKNRVAKGICPCCNRTFANLARHMATKHPEAA